MTPDEAKADTNPAGGEAMSELELTDEDVLDAMGRIPGYLDISTEDFRAIYHLAHAHALGRMFDRVRAGDLMLSGLVPLREDMSLREAAQQLVAQGRKSLPVVDDRGLVVGILTETDFLHCLKADSVLDLLLRLGATALPVGQHCEHTSVADTMSAPAVTVGEQAGFEEIMRAFRQHRGRSMPVVDDQGRLQGLLLRKDFLHACHQEDLA
jgi:CBS-domain-containing membrane protein